MEDHKIITISRILNDAKVFDRYANAIGIELDNDSPIFQEIEEFIVKKIDEVVAEYIQNFEDNKYVYEPLLKDLDI
jgi:hypothetical protein